MPIDKSPLLWYNVIKTKESGDTKMMRSSILIVNGCGGTGKDTFSNIIRHELEALNTYTDSNRVVLSSKYNYADLAKKALSVNTDFYHIKKTEKVRKFLADVCDSFDELGGCSFRAAILALFHDWSFAYDNDYENFVFIIDIRKSEIISQFKQRAESLPNSQVKTIYIKRSSAVPIVSNSADLSALTDTYPYDMTIDNSDADYISIKEGAGKIIADIMRPNTENLKPFVLPATYNCIVGSPFVLSYPDGVAQFSGWFKTMDNKKLGVEIEQSSALNLFSCHVTEKTEFFETVHKITSQSHCISTLVVFLELMGAQPETYTEEEPEDCSQLC